MKNTFVLVSHGTNIVDSECYCQAVGADELPRMDYYELANRLDAELVVPRPERPLAKFEKRLRLNLSESWSVLRRLPDGARVLSTSEKVALPLAMMTAVNPRQRQIKHVTIGHKLSSGGKTKLFRWWSPAKQVDHMICLARKQVDYAQEVLSFLPTNTTFVHDKIDQQFFRPLQRPEEPYVLAVGSEQRDYGTLLQAMASTGIDLVLVTSSQWNPKAVVPDVAGGRVHLKQHLSFLELRELYARAFLVVVPLHPVDYAAGVNSLLEGMAMGKAVVVTGIEGILDYVAVDETAVTVPAHDPVLLRQAILDLWQHPNQRQRLGDNARQAVVDGVNIDQYVAKIAAIVRA